MSGRGVLTVLVVLAAVFAFVSDVVAGAENGIPRTLAPIVANRYGSYAFFCVLAGFGIMLIYRGVRAR